MLLLLAGLTAGLSLVTGSATADPTISSKREQARAVLAEIQAMDSRLSHAIEAYNYANVRLGEIDDELRTNASHLVVAKKSLRTAQSRIAQRLKVLYINGGSGGVVEILLGARSLDDLLNRIDVVERVGRQDAKVLKEVTRFRKEVAQRRERLEQAHAEQENVVAQRAAQKQSIEGELAERQRLLASIKDEIVRLQAEERARQARLRAQARQRLDALRAAAEARAAAQSAEESEALLAAAPAVETVPDPALAVAAPPPDASRASQVISVAMQYLGVPYVWGGMSPAGFDCSGFTAYVFAQVGVPLPHHAASQFGYGVPVSQDALAPGDLVFFDGLGHMGMYIGGGQFIHAPHTGDVVKISSIYDSWYASTWVGARRVL